MQNPFLQQAMNANISNLVKQEVKIEADETASSVNFPSTCFRKEPLAPLYGPSDLYRALVSMMSLKLSKSLKSEPLTTSWPFGMPDPFFFKVFPQNRNNDFTNLIANTRFPVNNFGPINIQKKPDIRPKCSQSTSDGCESVLTKREETTEGSRCKCGEREKSPTNQKKVPKKKAQNRIKNIPGLVMQRVRSSIKSYFTLNPKLDRQEKRLGYIDKVLGGLNKSDKERLTGFLEGYQKNWKTWNTIQKYLQTNPKYGSILLDVVLEFFNEPGKEDFEDWLISGKMGQKSKTAVTEMKSRIGNKFGKILLKREDEEDDEELQLTSKLVKKEEIE